MNKKKNTGKNKRKIATIIIAVSLTMLIATALAFFSDYVKGTVTTTAGIVKLSNVNLLIEKDPYGDDTDYTNNMLPTNSLNWNPGDVTTLEWTIENTGNKSIYTRNTLVFAWNSTPDLKERNIVYVYSATMSDDDIRDDIEHNKGELRLNSGSDQIEVTTDTSVSTKGERFVFLGNVLDGTGVGAENTDSRTPYATFHNLPDNTTSQKIRVKLAFSSKAPEEYQDKSLYINVIGEALQFRNNPGIEANNEAWPDGIRNNGGQYTPEELLTPLVPNGWIPIYNKTQLTKVATGEVVNINGKDYTMAPDAKYIQMEDIDLAGFDPQGNGTGFKPIASFKGIFDGNGAKINNLTINRPTEDKIGLFGDTSGEATIKNVTLNSTNIIGKGYVGGIVGSISSNLTLENTSVSGTISSRGTNVGGLVGYSSAPMLVITNSNVSGTITTSLGDYAGGLVGYSTAASTNATLAITNSHNSASIIGTGSVGGLVGHLINGNATITSSYNTGNLLSKSTGYVGGILGYQATSRVVNITNSYNTGNISTTAATAYLGGIVGNQNGGTIEKSFNSGTITGLASSRIGGITGIQHSGTIRNSYNSGELTGPNYIGGVVGNKYTIGIIENVYSSGKIVSTSTNAGGLIGFAQTQDNITNSYWCTQSSTMFTSAGGTPYGIMPMLNSTTFTNWDFTNTWAIEAGSMPYLKDSNKPNTVLNSNNLSYPVYDGTGISTDPFLIKNEADLNNVRNYATAAYKVGNDITLTSYQTGTGWTPISNFKGSFDGDNHTIKNLYINAPTTDNLGLFGTTSGNITIKNTLLENVAITGKNKVGGIISSISAGTTTIDNCGTTGTISGVNNVGGLVGYDNGTLLTITNSYNKATITGTTQVGGIIGDPYGATTNITKSYNTGNISAKGTYAGGIAGRQSPSTIINITTTYNKGNVTNTINTTSYAAGIITITYDGIIDQCYNTGTITTTSTTTNYVGGIIGYQGGGTLKNSYTTGKIIGKANSFIGGAIGSKIETSIVQNIYSIGEIASDSTNAGGLIGGSTASSNISNSYWCTTTSKIATSRAGGTGYNSTQITAKANFSTWNFTTIWDIQVETTLPFLREIPDVESVNISALAPFEGAGTQEDPYLIKTETDLNEVRNYPSASYKVANDITLTSYQTGTGWTPIADFRGNFDGDNHQIINLYINQPNNAVTGDYLGLFSQLTQGATIKNLILTDVNITGRNYVGGIASSTLSSPITIDNCGVTGKITAVNYVGGILGGVTSSSITIDNSYNSATIVGTGYAGGMIGYITSASPSSSITNSYNTGNVTISTSGGAGIVGYQQGGIVNITNSYNTGDITSTGNSTIYIAGISAYARNGEIDKCYNTGKITSNYSATSGGLIGYQAGGTLKNSYNTGKITSSGYTGGSVGNRSATSFIENVYSTGEINSLSANAGGLVGGTTAQPGITNSYWCPQISKIGISAGGSAYRVENMLIRSSFAVWDFSNIWDIQEGTTFPYLRSQVIPPTVYKSNISYYDYDGVGTETDPFMIRTEADLDMIRNYTATAFKLGNNIELPSYQTGTGWTPIVNFSGTLDGDNYAINNLYINQSSANVGLFSTTKNTTTIKNLSLTNVNITGNSNAGGLIGQTPSANITTVDNCSITGTVKATGNYAGGIIAFSSNGNVTITNSYNAANVTAVGFAGGLIGGTSVSTPTATITNSYNTGNITTNSGSANHAGGILGNQTTTGTIIITDTYNTGTIQGGGSIGGIVGNAATGTIEKCYNTGSINAVGSATIGGLVGTQGSGNVLKNSYTTGKVTGTYYTGGAIGNKNTAATVQNIYSTGEIVSTYLNAGGLIGGTTTPTNISDSYWSTETSKLAFSAAGGTPYSQDKMLNSTNFGAWDFSNIWDIQNGVTTPYLRNMIIPASVYESNTSYYNFDGIGTIEDPFIVKTETDLSMVNTIPTGSYKLNNDITLTSFQTGTGFTPVTRYRGVFDGNNKTINNLYINNPTVDNQGLFSTTIGTVAVKKLNLNNVDITGKSSVGGIFGTTGSGTVTIDNCAVSGTVTGIGAGGILGQNTLGTTTISNSRNSATITGQSVGGIAGVMGSGTVTIENSYNTGQVTATSASAGGILGQQGGGTLNINYSYNTGEIVTSATHAGGLVGWYTGGTIEKNYNTGSVASTSKTESTSSAGGLIGYQTGGTVKNNYNTGTVTKDTTISIGYAGGITGRLTGGTIDSVYSIGQVTSFATSTGGIVGTGVIANTTNSYWATDTSTRPTSPGGGTGKTFAELTSELTFTGWDFTDIWTINEGVSTPSLRTP